VTGNAFTKRWLLALSTLMLVGIAFPFVIGPLARLTGCQRTGGACGAVALVLGMLLRLPLVIGAGIYIANLAWKRSTTLGLKAWGFIFVVISYLAASALLFGFGNFWATNFSLGVKIAGTLPALGFLLVGLGGLSLLSNVNGSTAKSKARSSTFAIGGVSMGLLLPAAVDGLIIIPVLNRIVFPISLTVMRLTPIFMYQVGLPLRFLMLLAFVISLAWWIKDGKTNESGVA
jgi:hypothetical protein